MTNPAFRRYIGIDHSFSFPLRYFEVHLLEPDWPAFLDDFQRHWPTDREDTYVDFIRFGFRGDGETRSGSARWRRISEERAGAKSVFHQEAMVSELIPKHGGYRKLKSFKVAQLVYDVTVRFCDRYVDKRSRTHDQMVQAARSGVQNVVRDLRHRPRPKRPNSNSRRWRGPVWRN